MKLFIKKFEKLASVHSYYQVWEDYLDMFINGVSFNYTTEEKRESWANKYTQEERYEFVELIKMTLLIYQKEINKAKWYDFFGHFYEKMSISKKNGFAQFFTPDHICDLMVKILDSTNETISDPTCGSSRLLLASNAHHRATFSVGIDLDFTCVKMSALNLFLHGIDGIVVCQNSLALNNFKGAFVTNKDGLLGITWVNKENVVNNYINNRLLKRTIENIEKEENTKETIENIKKYDIGTQLSMF